MGDGLGTIDAATHEAMLFAAVGLLIGGIDDLAVDLIFLARVGWRWLAGQPTGAIRLADLPAAPPRRLAVFVPAWREAAVIGAMLDATLIRYDHPRYRIYVGCYPNDLTTIEAVAAVAERDARVRLVIGAVDGPTTKADNLNTIWRALLRDDARDGAATEAVVLHDAEDVVHPAELRVYDALIGDHAIVQLPVLPLVQRRSRLVSGHYIDEFAESHGKALIVRELIGAGLPLAGTGCAIATALLRSLDAARGAPFDAGSLTEDYEFGLHAGQLGATATFVRVDAGEGQPVATRAYFPDTLDAAVRQKARWMIGIALAGWDRTGWSRWPSLGDHWMRARDRRAPLAVLVLVAAYAAMLGWVAGRAGHWLTGTPAAAVTGWLALLLGVNAMLLAWRTAMHVAFTARAYGCREACWAVPRMPVANLIAILAARRAMTRYLGLLAGGLLRWDKTEHRFPSDLSAIDRA